MKRTVFVILSIGIVVVGLLSATALAWRWLLQARTGVQVQEVSLEQLPETSARQVSARSELDRRALDIKRVSSFLVAKDQIGTVVAEIEAAAKEAGVEIAVPAVEEKEQMDASGRVEQAGGRLFEVRLKIVATGTPVALLKFLHAAEHMQRLVYLESFRLDGSDETSRSQARGLRRADVQENERPALVSADMVVAVQREEEGGSP